MEWMQRNWDSVLAVMGAVNVIAGVIVGWTKTKADDKALAKVRAFFGHFLRNLVGLQK
jgi:hypothetical protein